MSQYLGSDAPPHGFYSAQHQSSIGHSTSNAGFATSQQPRRPSFQRPLSTAGAPTGSKGIPGGGDEYLQAAQGINLSQEEKQEGYYDPDLLHSRPRNTTVPPPSSSQLARPTSPSAPASTLPYASRTGEGSNTASIDRQLSKTKGSLATREKAQAEKNGSGHYSSRPSNEPHEKREQHRSRHSRGTGRAARGGGGRKPVPRRKRKELKWWQKPRTFIALIAAITIIGVAVGLGVGLTTGKKEDERSPGNPTSTTASNGDGGEQVTAQGVQPSVSSVGGLATITGIVSSQARSTPRIETRNRIVNFANGGRGPLDSAETFDKVPRKDKKRWSKWQ
ncbi:hypothetical protein JCM16303_005533 [Sporobolomyces ruberrimus]